METFRCLGANIITQFGRTFWCVALQGSYVYVPEILNYDKIEDSVIDIALSVTD